MKTPGKKVKTSLLACLIAVSCGAAVVPSATAEAFSLGNLGTIGTLINAGAEYIYLDQQLRYLDNEGRDDFMKQIKKKYGVSTDERANAMLTRIVTNLSASIAQTDPSITKKPYNYFVNEDKDFNAFCTIGHNLSVNIGLFEPLNYNENEIAFIVAHEMGHGQKGHPISGIKKTMPISLIASIAGANGGAAEVGSAILSQIGTAKLITKPMEIEADALAFTYAVNAGYNIGGGAAVWQRVLDHADGKTKSSGVMELFNDHPTNINRLKTYSEDITKWSNGVVKVNGDSGMISLHDKDWYKPETIDSMSGKERAYLIAGNLSAVYHNDKTTTEKAYRGEDNILYVGKQPIMDLAPEKAPEEVTASLQKLL
ncbi:M48 family metallopeptidase [Megasphaera vaginalis (ex Srinivasan et al. 2021)]|uniref:Peptidase, M48 family n=1 Tax=Megasphaera vaginalis (ex Srinivasan et al. 2021) TaxID=1111454 RepID=U7UVK1_9FIRM|nr:M48 family metallopeptidase [Megasphaera vaginalis (ex Srinivasan et al. 2021)]ERT62498.1 peptidase, M48 family [Megasphaera vaginalis (ex Srinivasan et al. 2021)]